MSKVGDPLFVAGAAFVLVSSIAVLYIIYKVVNTLTVFTLRAIHQRFFCKHYYDQILENNQDSVLLECSACGHKQLIKVDEVKSITQK